MSQQWKKGFEPVLERAIPLPVPVGVRNDDAIHGRRSCPRRGRRTSGQGGRGGSDGLGPAECTTARGMMSPVDEKLESPMQFVNALAPIRICDIGGWTDTWFAGHGKVLNMGVHPCVEVRIRVHALDALEERIVLDAENFGERYGFEPGVLPDRHPLLEATIDEIGVPDDVSIEISVFSEAPAGSSTGTSASVTVALVGALDSLTSGRLTPQQIASTAHRIEVDRLGIESGIQDQLCAAYGGINYIEMPLYPRAVRVPAQRAGHRLVGA